MCFPTEQSNIAWVNGEYMINYASVGQKKRQYRGI